MDSVVVQSRALQAIGALVLQLRTVAPRLAGPQVCRCEGFQLRATVLEGYVRPRGPLPGDDGVQSVGESVPDPESLHVVMYLETCSTEGLLSPMNFRGTQTALHSSPFQKRAPLPSAAQWEAHNAGTNPVPRFEFSWERCSPNRTLEPITTPKRCYPSYFFANRSR